MVDGWFVIRLIESIYQFTEGFFRLIEQRMGHMALDIQLYIVNQTRNNNLRFG